MLSRRLGLVGLGFALALVGCHHQRPQTQPSRDAPTYVSVTNQLTDPYTMYVSDGTQRLRIGTANPLTTTRLRVPPNMVFPAITLQFIAVPLGGNGAAISESLAVRPGDTVGLTLAR